MSSEEEEGAFVSRAFQLIPHLNSAKCELDGEIKAPGSTRARWVSRSRTHRSGASISPSETAFAFAKIRATGHVRTRPLIERLTAFVSRDPRFRMQRVWRGMRRRGSKFREKGSLRDCSRIKRKEKRTCGSRARISSIALSLRSCVTIS